MGAVVPLPSAAPTKVRQRSFPSLPARTRRELCDGGKVARLPVGHWRPPVARTADAERAARMALYEAGGIKRSAMYVILSGVVLSLTPEQRVQVRRLIDSLAEYQADDVTRAAQEWFRQAAPKEEDA